MSAPKGDCREIAEQRRAECGHGMAPEHDGEVMHPVGGGEVELRGGAAEEEGPQLDHPDVTVVADAKR